MHRARDSSADNSWINRCMYFFRHNMPTDGQARREMDFPHERYFRGSNFVAGNFVETERFLNFCDETTMRAVVTMDQTEFLTGEYTKKRRNIGNVINEIMENMYNEVPPPHLRLEFANALSFIMIFEQLWSFTVTTLSEEQELGLNSYLPCSLVNKFEAYLPIIEEIIQYKHVNIDNFCEMIDLRDECVDALQSLFRVVRPMQLKKEEIFFPKGDFTRYSPYDYEWMCGSVISGPWHLACTKMLCITRMAQMDLSATRADIVAESIGTVVYSEDDIRVPMPEEVSNAKKLLVALQNRENTASEMLTKITETAEEKAPGNKMLYWYRRMAEFHSLRGKVRIQKREMMNLMVKADREQVRTYATAITYLGACEALLLICERVYAPFVDMLHGMYGTPIPLELLQKIGKIFVCTKYNNCRSMHRAKVFSLIMDAREALRKNIKIYYEKYEPKLENNYSNMIDYLPDPNMYKTPYGLSDLDFPDDIRGHVLAMLRNVRMEQIETERLFRQLAMVKRSRIYWPQEAEPFSLNTCTGIVRAFRSNYLDVIPHAFDLITQDTMCLIRETSNTRSIGEEIIKIAQAVMYEAHTIPEDALILSSFIEVFAEIIGDRTITGMTSGEIADRLAGMVVIEIDTTELRERFPNVYIDPEIVAKKMGCLIINHYLGYVEEHRAFFEAQVTNIYEVQSTSTSSEDEDDTYQAGSSGSGSMLDPRDAAHVALMLNALSLDAGAALMEAAQNAVFVDDPSELLLRDDEVPDHVVDSFIQDFVGFSFGPDLSKCGMDLPVD